MAYPPVLYSICLDSVCGRTDPIWYVPLIRITNINNIIINYEDTSNLFTFPRLRKKLYTLYIIINIYMNYNDNYSRIKNPQLWQFAGSVVLVKEGIFFKFSNDLILIIGCGLQLINNYTLLFRMKHFICLMTGT